MYLVLTQKILCPLLHIRWRADGEEGAGVTVAELALFERCNCREFSHNFWLHFCLDRLDLWDY